MRPVPRNPNELIEAARDLAPEVARSADAIEQERRLPASLVEHLAVAGLFHMLVPASIGGSETDAVTFARVLEQIAQADASTAWCIGQGAGCGLIACHLAPDAAADIFGGDRSIVAWGPGSGTFQRTASGLRLNGRWSFASGSHHATWLGGMARLVDENGEPELDENGSPQPWRLLFPADKAHFIDIWNVSGLRGTGSDSYEVSDLVVPEDHAYPCDLAGHPLPQPRYEPGRLYAFPSLYPVGFAGVALGIARASLDAFAALAGDKTPRGRQGLLRDNAVVQSQIGRAEAGWRSARAFLHETAEASWEAAGPAGLLPMDKRVLLRLASTHAIHSSAQVVDTVYNASGATAIFAGNPFERRFRDIHALTQQVQGSQIHYESTGQFFLGLEPDTSWL
jgi:alkylation response protein AidB-like acyl-CoA dehydrogenase